MAGLAAAGSLGGAAMQSSAAKSAAKTQADSATQALDFQKEVYANQQANQAPFQAAGKTSVAELMKGIQDGTFGKFQAPTLQQARNTPGYQFTQQQGIDAIDRSAAAHGSLGTGGTLKNIQAYGTGLADQIYNDVFSRALQGQTTNFNELMGVANLGENATQNVNAAGNQAAVNVGSLMTQQGNATAAGQVGSANAWSNGISGTSNGLLTALLLSGMGQQPQPAAPVEQPVMPQFNAGSGPGYGYGPPPLRDYGAYTGIG